jgi:MmyB-like transcription regulator ligand binding domain/Helix-turn-helix domain
MLLLTNHDHSGTAAYGPGVTGAAPCARPAPHSAAKEADMGGPSPHPAALAEFLASLRAGTDPADLPLIGEPVRASSRSGVSRAQAAEAVGMTAEWWSLIEDGGATLEAPYLERIARVFRLSAPSREFLYIIALGREPDSLVRPLVISPQTQMLLDGMQWPAYISDAVWDVHAVNRRMTELFPTIQPGTNIMVTAMCEPEVIARMPDWAQTWARPMLGQLRAAADLLPPPYPRAIAKLTDTVLDRNPAARDVWDKYPNTIYVHPDGAVRPLLDQDGHLIVVRLSATVLAGYPHSRMVVFTPEEPVWPPRAPDRQNVTDR